MVRIARLPATVRELYTHYHYILISQIVAGRRAILTITCNNGLDRIMPQTMSD